MLFGQKLKSGEGTSARIQVAVVQPQTAPMHFVIPAQFSSKFKLEH
jgi:hypothetical protein